MPENPLDDTWIVAAYWGPRAESVDTIADRLTALWGTLSEINDLFARWYKRGTSSTNPEVIPSGGPELIELLAGRALRNNAGGLMPGGGHRIGGWNGGNVSFDAKIGVTAPHMVNNAIITISKTETASLNPETCTLAVRALVETLSAEWATARGMKHADHQESFPHIGWLTYLQGSARIPDAEPFHDGNLYRAAPTPQEATTDTVMAMRDALLGGA